MNKRILSLILAGVVSVVIIVAGMFAVSAASFTKLDLLAEAAKSPVYKYIKEAVEELADGIDITDEQADSIMPYVKTAVEAITEDRGSTGYDSNNGHCYTWEENSAIMSCVNAVCDIFGWTYEGVPSEDPMHYGDIVFNLYNKDGELIFSYDGDERAKGIVFTKESGYTANTYTGYVGGVEMGATVENLLGALENKNGIEVKREEEVLSGATEVQHGDKLVLMAADGTAVTEFEIIFIGNADKYGAINLSDVSAMLKNIAGWENADIDVVAADVDGNGSVNLTDVSAVLKKIAKWNVEFVEIPVLPGKGDSRVSSVIQTFATGERSNINLRKGQDLAIKFSVQAGKYAKYVKANYPSWGDAKGSIRLSLYKWEGDYETTVAAMPIYTEKYENFADGLEIIFNFTDTAEKGVGEGEYLWRIHEGYDERVNPNDENEPVGVGMWTYNTPDENTGVTVFFEGEALAAGTAAYGPEAYIAIGG